MLPKLTHHQSVRSSEQTIFYRLAKQIETLQEAKPKNNSLCKQTSLFSINTINLQGFEWQLFHRKARPFT
ncbi:CLUMA_CG018848, isoform A [Clunio marinus]|uniref:CLUMA_CG018848, isoform A n=1 Tax=Clunio marinus TaxID=568069 RepID=A0A1J1J039_9DIPT|nr:CLUMA_CG018848, isoform A [Clunio marinus]